MEPITFQEAYVGMQIAYVPLHVKEMAKFGGGFELNSRGVEFGFITSLGVNSAFCRFFMPGARSIGGLRTGANSESASYDNLYALPEEYQVPQDDIEQFIKENYDYKGR